MRLTAILACIVLLLSIRGVEPAFSQVHLDLGTTAVAQPTSGIEPPNWIQNPEGATKKSPLLAVAYSLILPGLGDVYAENTQVGRYFIGTDVALWLGYAGVRAYGHWTKNDARAFATFKAGADFTGKDDQFEVNLGNFISVDEYNEAKLRNRQYELLYDRAGSHAWNWSTDGDRLRFKDMRIKGDEILRNSQFLIGALVVNRVIAAISAARSASAYNRDREALSGWSIQLTPPPVAARGDGIGLTLSKVF